MTAYIAQVQNTPQNQPVSPPQSFDPMVWFTVVVSGVGGFAASFIFKFMDSPIVGKSIDSAINQKKAETNASIAERLTDNNIDAQYAEGYINQADTVSKIATQTVADSANLNIELLNLVKESMTASQLNAESRNWIVEATKNLVASQKEAIHASENIAKSMTHLVQAQELTRVAILESHDLALQEFRVTCDRLSKQMSVTQNTVKDEFAGAIAQLRVDIRDSETKVLAAIKG